MVNFVTFCLLLLFLSDGSQATSEKLQDVENGILTSIPIGLEVTFFLSLLVMMTSKALKLLLLIDNDDRM